MSKNQHIAVLMGGICGESEVSLVSGAAVAQALKRLGYKVSEIIFDHNVLRNIDKIKPDIIFNALHGRYGEDGRVQGLLDIMQIPYTHSNHYTCSIAMNKSVTREICKYHDIAVAEGKLMKKSDIVAKIGLPRIPYVIKPNNEGSSLGVKIIKSKDDEIFHINDWPQIDELLVEEYIDGSELSAGIVQGESVGVIELVAQSGFYNYDAKYSNKTKHVMPANIPSEVYNLACYYAKTIHNIIGCRSISRSDFRYDKSRGGSGLYFLEINTHPGFTPVSLLPEMAGYSGITFEDICEILIKEARYEKR